MQANEFEKKIRESLDELKVHPTGKVWHGVEEAIRERKRKRRVIFFILFSFIGLLLLGFGIYYSTRQTSSDDNQHIAVQNENQNQSQNPDQKNDNKTGIKSNQPSAGKNNTANKRIDNTIIEIENKTNDEKNNVNTAKAKDQTNATTTVTVQNAAAKKIKESKVNMVDDGSVNIAVTNSSPVQSNKDSAKTITTPSETQITTTAPVIAKNDKSDEVNKVNGADSVNKSGKADKINKLDSAAVTNNTAAKKPNQLKTNKLRWGFNIAVGSSSLADEIFPSLGVGGEKMFAATPYGSSAAPGAYTGPVAPNYYAPSTTESGRAFSAGVKLQKDLSRRSSVAAGLQYTYFSEKILVGALAQSPISIVSDFNAVNARYYRGYDRHNYTNRFHFVELPVLYHWQVNKSRKNFVTLDAGASLNYLFASNALVYDTTLGGLYYHNKKLITKMNFGINAGFAFHHQGKKGSEWSIGPQFSFYTRPAFKTGQDNRKYFTYPRINFSLLFPNKKK